MISMKKKPPPEDMHLWDIHVKDVKPLRKQKKVAPKVVPKEVVIRPTQKTTSLKKVNVAPQAMSRKDIRGVEIDGRIDLHGMTIAQAEQALERFLRHAQERGYRTVLVITGKGALSAPTTLRKQFPEWLKSSPFRELVISFSHPVKPQHGGEGAFYMRVRRK